MLGGELAVLQAQMFDGLPFDPFSLLDDGAGPAEVGVSGRHMVGLARQPKTTLSQNHKARSSCCPTPRKIHKIAVVGQHDPHITFPRPHDHQTKQAPIPPFLE